MKLTDEQTQFLSQLRVIRKKLNLEQKEIADKLGVSLFTYCNWESMRFYPAKGNERRLKNFIKNNMGK